MKFWSVETLGRNWIQRTLLIAICRSIFDIVSMIKSCWDFARGERRKENDGSHAFEPTEGTHWSWYRFHRGQCRSSIERQNRVAILHAGIRSKNAILTRPMLINVRSLVASHEENACHLGSTLLQAKWETMTCRCSSFTRCTTHDFPLVSFETIAVPRVIRMNQHWPRQLEIQRSAEPYSRPWSPTTDE